MCTYKGLISIVLIIGRVRYISQRRGSLSGTVPERKNKLISVQNKENKNLQNERNSRNINNFSFFFFFFSLVVGRLLIDFVLLFFPKLRPLSSAVFPLFFFFFTYFRASFFLCFRIYSCFFEISSS